MIAVQRTLLGILLTIVAIGIGTGVTLAQDSAQNQDPASLWEDFNHYVRIARPELADAAGTALLNQVNRQQLLDIVETSDYSDYEHTLLRAARIESLETTSQRLGENIQSARIERSREPKRIVDDIHKLDQGKRANANATKRLKAAGQFAAPYLLASLLDEQQKKRHSMVVTAMVAVGQPMVYPLSVTLRYLEPVPLGQTAQVLAEIGYPQAMPYLKEVLENSSLNPTTRAVVQSAYDRLAKNTTISDYATASGLFLELGWKHYAAGTNGTALPGFDSSSETGLAWDYDREAGLISISVPGAIYADVLAMRTASRALRLSPQLDASLSLWLMANLRRENRLPKGAQDRSYPNAMHSPSFYLEMSGPLRQHDVLNRALSDSDVDLAIDAIAALTATAGTEALINREGAAQPLLRALAYPDRRVRFSAAIAMTNARPRFRFPGSDLVVPVLAEAVRQNAMRHAVVIGQNQESLNALLATSKDLGYRPIGGLAIDDIINQINTSPSIDLIVIENTANPIKAMYRQTSSDYRLATVPILAIVAPLDKIELERQLPDSRRLVLVEKSADIETLKKAFAHASEVYSGQPITSQESDRFALVALAQLRGIAANRSAVYNVTDAQPTLAQALSDTRQRIAAKAATVLSLIDNPDAQRAIANAALSTSYPNNLRIDLLESLSESARLYRNYLSDIQLAKLLRLVKTTRGELINAAAQAHGALTLPTSDVVQLILK